MAIHSEDMAVNSIGTALSMTNESTSVISGTNNERWAIDDESKDIFDWQYAAWAVEVDDSSTGGTHTLGTDEYDLEYLIGVVRITNYTSGSGSVSNITAVRISEGQYYPYARIASTQSANRSLSRDTADLEHVGDEAVDSRYTLLDYEATIERSEFDLNLQTPTGTKRSLLDALENENIMVVTVERPGTGKERGAVRVSSEEESGEPGDIQSSSVTLPVTEIDAAETNQTARSVRYRPR